MADWSLLPRDLLERIIGCFETCFEIVHFRSVCSSWRLAVPPPNHSRRLAFNSFLPFFSGNRRFGGLTSCKLKKIPVSLLRFQTPFGADCLIVAMSESKSGKQKLLSPLNYDRFAHGIVLNTLTTQTIFLGHHYEVGYNLCYPAKELPGMKGNCVVFFEHSASSESIRVFDFITRKTNVAFTECIRARSVKIENLCSPAEL